MFQKMFTLGMLVFLLGCASTGDEEVDKPIPLGAIDAELTAKIVWQHKLKPAKAKLNVKLVPYAENKLLFVADGVGRLRAYELETGKLIWRTQDKIKIVSPIGGGKDYIFAGTQDAKVVAFQASSGKILWQGAVSSEVLAQPLLVENRVIARTGDGKIFGLDLSTGQYHWVYERSVPALSLRGISSSVVYESSIYAGFDNGKVVALSANDGKLQWEQSLAIPTGRSELERMVDIDADPIISDDTLYVVSYQGKIAALDINTGRQLWSREMSSYTGMDLDKKNIYVSDAHGNLWAIDRSSGATVWKQEKLFARNVSAPVLHEGNLVVADYEGYVHWLSVEDGHFVGRLRIDTSAITVKPYTNKHLLFVRTIDGLLAAVKIQPGKS